jgi:pimeloyl-ACP methyl ester carboxylesterase
MELLQTTSFQLATIIAGDTSAQQLVLALPGRLDSKDYIHMTSLINLLGQQGYLAVSFDPPGTWESPGGINLFTTTNYLKAINELIVYFGNRSTILIGHSRGGTAAALASDNPLVAAIILIMANYGAPTPPESNELKAGQVASHRDLPPGDHITEGQKEFALPLTYFEDGAQYNPIIYLKACHKPKLIIYGTNDEFTSHDAEQRLFKTLPSPKQLFKVDSEHNYRLNPKATQQINTRVLAFLNNVGGYL